MRRFIAASVSLQACGGGGPPPFAAAGVSVAAVVKKPVTEWDEFSGRIEAVESVELRPRVTGYLTGVHFHEGGDAARTPSAGISGPRCPGVFWTSAGFANA